MGFVGQHAAHILGWQSARLALTDIFTVDHNMFGIAPRAIGDTKVVITIVGGKIVYEADAK
jgi:hypothetical protein